MHIRSITKSKPKKNGFEDGFFVLVVLFAIVIFILVLAKVWGNIKPEIESGLQSAMPSDTSVNISTTLNTVTSTTNMFDNLFPFVMLGLFGFVLIGAGMYAQHPIFIFIGIVIAGITIFLGAVYANIYHQIASTDEFASTTNNFSISNLYMQYLPFVLFIMFIGIGAMVIWLRSGGGTGTL